MFSDGEFFLMIGIIGIATLIIRGIFLFYIPKTIEKPSVKRGMEAVPSSMLVALVIPFTLFYNQSIDLYRPEVFAILCTIPIVIITKRYAYGLVIATIWFVLFSLLI